MAITKEQQRMDAECADQCGGTVDVECKLPPGVYCFTHWWRGPGDRALHALQEVARIRRAHLDARKMRDHVVREFAKDLDAMIAAHPGALTPEQVRDAGKVVEESDRVVRLIRFPELEQQDSKYLRAVVIVECPIGLHSKAVGMLAERACALASVQQVVIRRRRVLFEIHVHHGLHDENSRHITVDEFSADAKLRDRVVCYLRELQDKFASLCDEAAREYRLQGFGEVKSQIVVFR